MMMFQWFKQKSERRAKAQKLYQAALFQSRHPDFYAVLNVPDIMDGRFDLLSIHICLIIDRLNECGKEGILLGQALFDAMFRRMDLDLREMGVGDLGVPKHMKRMMTAFHGRANVYKDLLDKGDMAGLEQAITRNLYKADGQKQDGAEMMTHYVVAMRDCLQNMDSKDALEGVVEFPPVLFAPTSNAQQRA